MKIFFYLILIGSLTACSHPAYGRRASQPLSLPLSPSDIPIEAKSKKKSSPSSVLMRPELQTLIVLDPGHGGRDLGTHSRKIPKYQEKHLTLATTKLVKNNLEKMGYKVSMTRTRDNFVALDKRSAFANDRDTELFVSIHYNSAPNKSAEGIEIFYYRSKENAERSKESKILAEAILKQIVKNTSAKSRGVKHGNLSVIRETMMPAVLVEGGFLTNEVEVKKIKNPHYMDQLAQGISDGIHSYLTQ